MLLRPEGDGYLLAVRVQPRASREAVVGVQGEALKVALHAPPVEGAANEALRSLLAHLLGTAKSRVTLRRGESSRDKLLYIEGAEPAAVAAFVQRWEVKGDG